MKFSIASLLTASAAIIMQHVRSADFNSSQFIMYRPNYGVEELMEWALSGGVISRKLNKTSDGGSLQHMGIFTNGPLGMPWGAILSSGWAKRAEKARDPN